MDHLDSKEFVAVFRPYNTTQSGIIQNALEQNDIVCYVNNESASGIRFGGMGIGAATMMVMVPENQQDKALKIIADLGLE